MCHIRRDATCHLTDFTEKSWKKLKEAAEICRDQGFCFLSENFPHPASKDGTFGSYHGVCYQFYTNKTHLERIQSMRKHPGENSSSATEVSAAPSGWEKEALEPGETANSAP